MKKIKLSNRLGLLTVIFPVIMAIVIPLAILMVVNPMRGPQFMINIYVLRLTPLGTHIDDVVEIVENNDRWRIRNISYEWGFRHPRPDRVRGWPNDPVLPPGWILSEWNNVIVGDKYIRVDSGPYWPAIVPVPVIGFFMTTSSSIFWGFDEDGKLIAVYVWQGMR